MALVVIGGNAAGLSAAARARRLDPSLPIGFGEVPYRPDQVMHLEADITRLKQATSWRPSIGLAEGIRRTVEWYRTQDA